MTHFETKEALTMCNSFEAFDKILNTTWCQTTYDKVRYLKQLFNVQIVDRTDNNLEADYHCMAQSIMKHAS